MTRGEALEREARRKRGAYYAVTRRSRAPRAGPPVLLRLSPRPVVTTLNLPRARAALAVLVALVDTQPSRSHGHTIHGHTIPARTPGAALPQSQPQQHDRHGRIQSSCPSGRSTTSRARARCCASSLIWRHRGRSSSGARCPASMSSAAALATARATASASPSAARPACGPPAARARPAGTAPRARCATPRPATLRTAAGC